jgi:hypothetical protein
MPAGGESAGSEGGRGKSLPRENGKDQERFRECKPEG